MPLILAGPGIVKGVSPRAVGLIDLYPTLSELCGLPKPPQKLEGRSLITLLNNPQAKWPHPALTTFHRNDHTLRTERWRYIRYANGDEELYDHAIDTNEWNNLAKNPNYQKIITRLKMKLPKVNAPNSPSITKTK